MGKWRTASHKQYIFNIASSSFPYLCNMTKVQKATFIAAGVLLGAVGGYMYYYFVGCANGACAIKSNPWLMILYGSVMGGLLTDLVVGLIQKYRKNGLKSEN